MHTLLKAQSGLQLAFAPLPLEGVGGPFLLYQHAASLPHGGVTAFSLAGHRQQWRMAALCAAAAQCAENNAALRISKGSNVVSVVDFGPTYLQRRQWDDLTNSMPPAAAQLVGR